MKSADLASAPSAVGAPTIPEHALIRPIASGSYGEVWLARNTLGAYRAVKIVRRASFDHDRPFEREFAGIRAFEPVSRSQEGLVDLLQVGRDNPKEFFYYVMELADNFSAATAERKGQARNPAAEESLGLNEKSDGEAEGSAPDSAQCSQPAYAPHTLAADLKRDGRRSLDECIRLGLSLTDALVYLHGQGLVHRDIKPSNIIFVGGVPKLADVGLVVGIGEARSYVGSEGFIPPEGPGTPQADLYSLGLVLYQISTGKGHQDFPEPLPDLAAQPDHALWLEFNAVVHKACQADVRQRYRSAEEMHAELALLLEGRSVKRRQQRQRRWKFARSVIPAVSLIAALFGIWAVSGRSPRGDYEGKPSPIREANRLFDQGQHQYEKKTATSLRLAMDYFERALRTDTNFAKAYAWLAACQTWSYATTNRPFELLPQARSTALHALSLDKGLGRAYMALAWHAWLEEWDWQAADRYFRRAQACAPAISEFYETHGLFQSSIGFSSEALDTLRTARSVQPTSISARHFLASALISARRYREAIEQLKAVIEMEPAGTLMTYGVYADALVGAKRFEEAVEMEKQEKIREGIGEKEASDRALVLLAAYKEKGEGGYWRQLLDWAKAQEKGTYYQARLNARLGNDTEALSLLEGAVRLRDWSMVFGCHSIKADPAWGHLRNEPRFKAVLKQIKLPN